MHRSALRMHTPDRTFTSQFETQHSGWQLDLWSACAEAHRLHGVGDAGLASRLTEREPA